MSEREETIDQDAAAALVRGMIDEHPWKDHMWSRAALGIAARAIERGRHLTGTEKLGNLKRSLGLEEPTP